MIAVVQRVKHSHVMIDGEIVGSCEKGLMVLLVMQKGNIAQQLMNSINH
jgi:D-Tyr-tRNAtyr deacylase